MSFSEKLRIEREKHGYNQKEFAEQLNLPPNTYNGYETGKRMPSLDVVRHIADNLDVSIDYLLDREFKKSKDSYEFHCNKCGKNHSYTVNEIVANYNNINRDYILDAINKLADKVENTYLLKQIYLHIFMQIEFYNLIDREKDRGLMSLRNHIVHSVPSQEELEKFEEFVRVHNPKINNIE